MNPAALAIGAFMAWTLGSLDRTTLSDPLFSAGLVLWVMSLSVIIERILARSKSERTKT